MNLKSIHQYFDWYQFDVLNGGVWEPGFSGRFAPVDRFLSNFNKPLRRRMLFVDTEAAMPASGVIRDPATQAIYMVGQSRKDAYDAKSYQRVVVCHLTDTSTTVRRKAPQGPANDPGWLVESSVVDTYCDLELRSGSEVDGAEDKFYGNYFLHLPPGTDVAENDYFTLAGQDYQVQEVYADSGFTMARVASEPDARENLVLEVDGSGSFDFNTGTKGVATQSYNVTGKVIKEHDARENLGPDSHDYLTIVFEKDHVGFELKAGMRLIREGRRFDISTVDEDLASGQWRVRAT